MKLTFYHFLVFFTISIRINAQTYWTREPEPVPGGQNAKLGNADNRSLNLVTDNKIRVIADSTGLLRINSLAGKGYRLVYVDSLGNLGVRAGGVVDGFEEYFDACDPNYPYTTSSTDPFFCPSKPCILNSGPWYEGGNKIGLNGNSTIGTCNLYDFILKANGSNRLWIKTDGKIGIGTSSPSGNLELQDASNAEIISKNTAANPASLWVINTSNSYALNIDNGGIGYISQNRGSLHNLLGFKYNSSNTIPQQVWVGVRPTSGTHTDFNFAVGGKLVTKSLYVSVSGTWADYVLDKNYNLRPLSEVELFINKNGHLPGVPKAAELEGMDYGLNVPEMQKIQMEKIEELYLYVIKLEKEINKLKVENVELKNRIEK